MCSAFKWNTWEKGSNNGKPRTHWINSTKNNARLSGCKTPLYLHLCYWKDCCSSRSCRYGGIFHEERLWTQFCCISITSFSSQNLRVDVIVSILRPTNLQRGPRFYFDQTRIFFSPYFFFFIILFFSYSNDPHPPQHARLAARLLVDKQRELRCWKLQGNISASSV